MAAKQKTETVMTRQPTNQLKQSDPKNSIVYCQALPSLVLLTDLQTNSLHTHTHKKKPMKTIKIAQTKAEIGAEVLSGHFLSRG